MSDDLTRRAEELVEQDVNERPRVRRVMSTPPTPDDMLSCVEHAEWKAKGEA